MTSLPDINVLFSDDVRFEQGGKITLVGIYGAEITFLAPLPPPFMPKLGVFFSVRWPPEMEPGVLDVELRWPSSEPISLARASIDFAAAQFPARPDDVVPRGAFSAFTLEMVPVRLNEALHFIHHHDGQERVVGRVYMTHRPGAALNAPPPAPPEPPREAKPRGRRRSAR